MKLSKQIACFFYVLIDWIIIQRESNLFFYKSKNKLYYLSSIVMIWILLSINSYASELSINVDSEKLAEISRLKSAIKQSNQNRLSRLTVKKSVNADIMQQVKNAEIADSSVNLIVNLRDDYCESEIKKRSSWNRKEKIYLMKELRKEIQADVVSKSSLKTSNIIRHFDPFNSMEVEISSEAELMDLMHDSRVKSVEKIMPMKPLLGQSLPLIQSDLAAAQGREGAGVSVAVIDSGIDYTLPYFGTCSVPLDINDPNCSVIVDLDFGVNDGLAGDSLSDHGTRVAGVVRGVAGSADIIGLDVFENSLNPVTTSAVVMQALQWVATNAAVHNIAAVNLSLGGGLYSGACDSAGTGYSASIFATLQSVGVVPVAASGNDGAKQQMSAPACISGAVSVGAVSDLTLSIAGFNFVFDQIDDYSNSSPVLDLLAPGSLIAMPGVSGSSLGTSFAAPHVAGAFALIRASDGFPADTVVQSIQRLKDSGDLIRETSTGKITPRINVARAFELISVPEITSPSDTATLTSSSETFTWDANGTPVSEWWLYLGTSPGARDIIDTGSLATSTTYTATNLPVDGSMIHARLFYRATSGQWQNKDFTYTAFVAPRPEITSPVDASTLTSGSETFNFNANGNTVSSWWLYLGTGVGKNDIYDSGDLGATASATVNTLPTDGSTSVCTFVLSKRQWCLAKRRLHLHGLCRAASRDHLTGRCLDINQWQ